MCCLFCFLSNMFVYWYYFWNLVTQRLQLEQTLLNQVCFLCILLLLLLLCLFSLLKWLFLYEKNCQPRRLPGLPQSNVCVIIIVCFDDKMLIFVLIVCRLRWIVCWVVMTICLNHILPVRLRYYYYYYYCCDVFLIHFFSFCSFYSVDSATATAFLFYKPLYTYQRSKW